MVTHASSAAMPGDRDGHLAIEVVVNRVCGMLGMLDLMFRSV